MNWRKFIDPHKKFKDADIAIDTAKFAANAAVIEVEAVSPVIYIVYKNSKNVLIVDK